MDAQILQELASVRAIVLALAVTVGVFIALFTFLMVLNYLQNRETKNKSDLFAHGNALLNKGKLDELIECTSLHLLEFPADAGAYWLKATAHYRRKEWNLALVCYRKADELQPGFMVGPTIEEIQEKIASAGTSPDLKVVAPVAVLAKQPSKDEA